MFDDNHMDDLMKSILESGQEEVPARVWDGISEGLDKAERRSRVVLWFARAGAVAAAAAVAVGVVLNMGQEDTFVPVTSESDMIAVVPKQEVPESEETSTMSVSMTPVSVASDLMAHAEPVAEKDADVEDFVPDNTPDAADNTPAPAASGQEKTPAITENGTAADEDEGSWEEDETGLKSRRLKTSFVLSGIAGTNSPQNKGGLSPMKSPALGKHYSENTIEYVGSDIIYGVPFSVGAGIRIELTKRLSLGIGLNYSMLTSKFDGKYIKVSEGEIEPIWEKTKNIQHYIGVPLNIYYNIISQDFINFYAYAGGTVEKCVMNKYQIQTSPVINHTEKVKKVQMSANIGVGVEFLAGRHVGIYIDPSLRYYFRNGQPKSIRTAQPLMLGFEMGLRFRI